MTVAQMIAMGMDSQNGKFNCIAKRYVKYAEKVRVMAWAIWKNLVG
jgi:hypothetical protein